MTDPAFDQPAQKKRKTVGGAKGARPAAAAAEPEADAGKQDDFVNLIPVPRNLLYLTNEDPGWQPVRLHRFDKAPGVTLSDDLLSFTSAKGYRMARATHGAHEGAWYFEISFPVGRLAPTGHARVGWSTRDAEVQGPVGYDKHSYGYRSKLGHKIHEALREDYGLPYGEGDVVGCYLYLPPGGRPMERKRSDIVKNKGQFFFVEELDKEGSKPLPGAIIAFSVNGALQGAAYRDTIREGTYYPAASLFTEPGQTDGATATFNFGPDFKHPFPADAAAGLPAPRPISDLAGPPPPKPPTPPPARPTVEAQALAAALRAQAAGKGVLLTAEQEAHVASLAAQVAAGSAEAEAALGAAGVYDVPAALASVVQAMQAPQAMMPPPGAGPLLGLAQLQPLTLLPGLGGAAVVVAAAAASGAQAQGPAAAEVPAVAVAGAVGGAVAPVAVAAAEEGQAKPQA